MQQMDNGFWAGFVPGLREGEGYMYYVVGPAGGTEGLKRDPYARSLSFDPAWPDCHCLLVDPAVFPWHDEGFHPASARDAVIYQLTSVSGMCRRGGRTFLDVVRQLPYLKALGINAIQPLPVVEFPTMFSLGYNGVDYFSRIRLLY
jgi:1,4-alpha-glucan branching enzyme